MPNDASHEDYNVDLPPASNGFTQDHSGLDRSGPRTSRFIYDTDEPEFDELLPPERSPSGLLRAIAFFLSMAFVGSGAGAIWHYYAPDLAMPASTRDVEKLNDSIGQLAQEQRKLGQTISALQLVQDAFQKMLAAREQDIQRLSAEARAIRTDLDALRNAAAATPTPHPPPQVPKRPSSPHAAKKQTERNIVRPEAEREPMALSPRH